MPFGCWATRYRSHLKPKLRATSYCEALYNCRHTYLTERLRPGGTSDILAINCGTSVEMISRHYNHFRAERIREALRPTDVRNPLRLKASPSPRAEAPKIGLDPNGQMLVLR